MFKYNNKYVQEQPYTDVEWDKVLSDGQEVVIYGSRGDGLPS